MLAETSIDQISTSDGHILRVQIGDSELRRSQDGERPRLRIVFGEDTVFVLVWAEIVDVDIFESNPLRRTAG